jgi:hypothetical protein
VTRLSPQVLDAIEARANEELVCRACGFYKADHRTGGDAYLAEGRHSFHGAVIASRAEVLALVQRVRDLEAALDEDCGNCGWRDPARTKQ